MGQGQDTGGLTTALRLLGAAGGGPEGDEQADLFEAPAPLPLPAAPRETGRAGRPAGARNKSTDEWVRYFLGRYRSPLTVLAELYSRPLEELVDQLQEAANKHKAWRDTKDGGYWERALVSPVDVLRLQRDAAVALLPYIHKRQPMALEVEQRTRGIVVLGDLGPLAEEGHDDLALPLAPTVQNQEVSEANLQQSDAQQSDGAELSRNRNALGGDGG